MAAAITGRTRLAAVIGSPVRHSLSPALHNAAFDAAGLDWRFVAFEVAAGHGAAAVAAMRALGIGGLAVTTPHKSEVAAAVDEVDVAAAALLSVNTVVLRDDGTTFGASTDGAGFVDSLLASGVTLEGRRVVVLGAGAAARSIVDALGRTAVADLAIVNRTLARAEQAACLAPVARVGTLGDIAAADVLVNATSIGMQTRESPLDPRPAPRPPDRRRSRVRPARHSAADCCRRRRSVHRRRARDARPSGRPPATTVDRPIPRARARCVPRPRPNWHRGSSSVMGNLARCSAF